MLPKMARKRARNENQYQNEHQRTVSKGDGAYYSGNVNMCLPPKDVAKLIYANCKIADLLRGEKTI